MKRGFVTRASKDRKHSVSDRLRLRRGAINEVHGRGDLRRHRRNAWRLTAMESTCLWARASVPALRAEAEGATTRQLVARPGVPVMVVKKQGSYLAVAVAQTELKRSLAAKYIGGTETCAKTKWFIRGQSICFLLHSHVRSWI